MNEDIQSYMYGDLKDALEDRAKPSKTSKLWLDFLTMSYVRAEREGDWHLHVFSVRAMIYLTSLHPTIIIMLGQA